MEKRSRLLMSPVSLVEIDLLRGGARVPTEEELPAAGYFVIVSRARRRPAAEAYSWSVRETLTHVPIPLARGAKDAALDLQAAVRTGYDYSGLDYRLDYSAQPTPPWPAEAEAWARSVVERSAAPPPACG